MAVTRGWRTGVAGGRRVRGPGLSAAVFLAGVALLGLLACAGTASGGAAPKPARPDQARWIRRVRLVWRTHSWLHYTRTQQRKAEKEVLVEGRKVAAAELGRLLKARPLSDPVCLQTAFAMALLDLDYEAGRTTLLRYLRALSLNRGPEEVDWEEFHRAAADPEAPEDEREVDVEGIAGAVYDVYQRRADPKLLAGLLDLAPYTDGDLSEAMGVILHRVARKAPRALLAELERQPAKVWEAVPYLIGFDLMSGVAAEKALPALARLAKDKKDGLHAPAARLLRGIREGQRAAG